MENNTTSREKLQEAARDLFWARGYSNVGLREVARQAGVDVALVKRHFGDKRGLFEATLDGAFDTSGLPTWSVDELIETVVRLFAEAPRDGRPSVTRLVEMNASDPEVGDLVRERWTGSFQKVAEDTFGDAGAAALFTAALLGFALAEKSLGLDGIATPGSRAYADQLRRMLRVAVG